MGFLISFLLAAVAAAVVSADACPPGRSMSVMGCTLHDTAPLTFAGNDVSVYTLDGAWDGYWISAENIASLMSEAVSKSTTVYSTFASETGIINIVGTTTVPDLWDDEVNSIAFAAYDLGSCNVWILADHADQSFEVLQQTVAHEIYHCYQHFTDMTPVNSNWRTEGGSEYFSNVVYPTLNTEHRTYDIEMPMAGDGVSKTQMYAANRFWQFLSTGLGWDDAQIDSWIRTKPSTTTPSEDLNILQGDPEMAEAFHKFAQATTLRDIKDTDGTLVFIDTTEIKINPLGTAPQPGNADSYTVDAAGWAMRTYYMEFDPKDTVMAAAIVEDPNVRVYYIVEYLPKPGQTWTQLTDTPTKIKSCGTGKTVTFLIVSTAGMSTPEQPKLDIEVLARKKSGKRRVRRAFRFDRRQIEEDDGETCEPEEEEPPAEGSCSDKSIPLDSCLLGNWNIDFSTLTALLREKGIPAANAAGLGQVTITDVQTSGTSSFTVTDDSIATMSHSPLNILMTMVIEGPFFPGPTDISSVMNGAATGQIYMQPDGEFCWASPQVEGTLTTTLPLIGDMTTPLAGDGAGETPTFSPDMMIRYTCTAVKLELTGHYPTGDVWTLAYSK